MLTKSEYIKSAELINSNGLLMCYHFSRDILSHKCISPCAFESRGRADKVDKA